MHWFLEKVRDVRRVDAAALQLGLGRSVVYDLLKLYRQRSQTSSLLLGKARARAQSASSQVDP